MENVLQQNTVEPVLKDHPTGHNKVVCQDRWSLVTGSVILKCRSFCQKSVVFQRQVVSHGSGLSRHWFHCIAKAYAGHARP